MDIWTFSIDSRVVWAALLLSPILIALIALKPARFWPMLIVATIGTSGMTYLTPGYALLDEYLASCIILGVLIAVMAGTIRGQKEKMCVTRSKHSKIFLTMMVYLLFESLRGMIILQDLRIIRYVLLFLTLGILSYMMAKKELPPSGIRNVAGLIVLAVLFQLGLYYAHGLYTESYTDLSRYEVQSYEWAGTAYAIFPLLIGVTALPFLQRKGGVMPRLAALILIALGIELAYYYDSRWAWLTLTTYGIFWFLLLSFRKKLIVLSLFFWIAAAVLATDSIEWVKDIIQETRYDIYIPMTEGRLFYNTVAFSALIDSVVAFFVGYGFYAHRVILTAYVPGYEGGFVRVTGFSGFIVDVGVGGFALFVSNFVYTFREILQENHILTKEKTYLCLSLFFSLLWFFSTPLQDVFYYYLIIMPGGLLVQLAQGASGEYVQNGKREFLTWGGATIPQRGLTL
jgi:hypothetical protein